MISCDEFLKILVEEDGGNTPESRAALAEHEAACDDCRELKPTLKEAYEAEEDPTEPDEREEKIMALARAHVAKNVAQQEKAEPKPPIKIGWWRPLAAIAAVLLAGVIAMHLVSPSEDGHFAPGSAKDARVRMIWANDFHRQHDDAEARKYAQLVADDDQAPPELREEARKLLAELK